MTKKNLEYDIILFMDAQLFRSDFDNNSKIHQACFVVDQAFQNLLPSIHPRSNFHHCQDQMYQIRLALDNQLLAIRRIGPLF